MTDTTTATRTGALTELTELTGEYTIDPTHSRMGFVARHALVTKVRGLFNQFEGKIQIDGAEPTNSKAEVTIDVASIDTGQDDRDNHLRTNDFFAMEEYPEITFVTTAIQQTGDTEFEVTGDLTMRGVSKPITLDVEFLGVGTDPYGNTRLGFEGKVTVNRKDWGINWNAPLETGGVLVSEKVTLEFEVAAVKVS